MHIKQCRFILNTLNKTAEKNKLKVKPRITSTLFLDNVGADANPYTAEIRLNKIYNFRIFRPITRKYIKHEVKHIEQYQIMARYFAGLAENIDKGLNNFKDLILQKFPHCENSKFNEKFYKKTIAECGLVTKGHPLFEKAKEYVEALKQYPDLSILDDIEVLANKGFTEMKKYRKQKRKLYRKNLLEVEARIAAKQK